MTLYFKSIDTTHVMLILNHICYKANADGSQDNGAGKEESPQAVF